MSRMCFRNKQPYWYALYDSTVKTFDEYGNESGASATCGNPVKAYGNISPARGNVLTQQFGVDENYDKVIVTGERDTPIDETTVLWIDTEPELDQSGALKVNADGAYVTPWDYIVRRVGRGLPNFGSTVIAVNKVVVSGGPLPGPVSA